MEGDSEKDSDASDKEIKGAPEMEEVSDDEDWTWKSKNKNKKSKKKQEKNVGGKKEKEMVQEILRANAEHRKKARGKGPSKDVKKPDERKVDGQDNSKD